MSDISFDFSSRFDEVRSRIFSVVPAGKPGEVPVVELYFPLKSGAGFKSSLAFGKAGWGAVIWSGFGSMLMFFVGILGFVISNAAADGEHSPVKSFFGFMILASFLLFVMFLVSYRLVFHSGKRKSLKVPLVVDSSDSAVIGLLERLLILGSSAEYSWEAHGEVVNLAHSVNGVQVGRSVRNAPAVFKGFFLLMFGSLIPS